jgi:hypothetical protein
MPRDACTTVGWRWAWIPKQIPPALDGPRWPARSWGMGPAASGQSPTGDQIFLDHVGYFVDDLDRAARDAERLGFQVSPINVQMRFDDRGELVETGTSNRLMMLGSGFLEVLAATSQTALAAELRQAIQRYQGLHLIAFTHADVTAQRRRLMEAGFQMQEVVQLRRPVRVAPDQTRQTHIDVLRPMPGQMSEGRVQLLTNHTPDLFWRPGTTDHANAAVALTGVTLLVDDAAAVAGRYGRYTARPPGAEGDQQVIRLDRGQLRFLPAMPRFLTGPVPRAPYMLSVSVGVADLQATAAALRERGVQPLIDSKHEIWLAPADALGSYLRFQPADEL